MTSSNTFGTISFHTEIQIPHPHPPEHETNTATGYKQNMNSNTDWDTSTVGKIPAVEDGGWKKDSSFVQTSTGWMERTR
jgi:hypothetical protein